MVQTTLRHRANRFTMCALLATVLALSSVFVSAQRGVSGNGDPDSNSDPCNQAVRARGIANGLHERCEGNGGGGGVARGDFNADGLADLAVGVPFEDQDGINAVGGVNVFYGSATGLTSAADLFLDETDFGFSYTSNDHFGWALASGDFNGDTHADLAIGMPDADIGSILSAGRVLLIDGSPTGLELATARVFSLLPSGRGGGGAGTALVWADFNADGFGDLAVGVPGAAVSYRTVVSLCALEHTVSAGEVEVYYGSSAGLTELGAQRLFQKYVVAPCPTNGGIGTLAPNDGDGFGSTLAAGNFNGDTLNGRAVFDLVIGAPFDDLQIDPISPRRVADAGVVYVIPGGANGLDRAQTQTLSQSTSGIGGGAEAGDQFGRALASGDFNADLHDDLAIGVPFEDLVDNTRADAGAVHVLFGSFASGELVTTAASLFISQNNLPGTSNETGDRFGWALATGRFNNDFRSDLAIGSPGEDVNATVDAGIVQVLYGSSAGLSLTTAQLWRQGAGGVPDAAEAGDQFGYALSSWNYGRDDRSDLAIGAPFEDLVSSAGIELADAGAVVVIYGTATATGLTATTANPAQFWHQDASGVNDTAQIGDRFGHSLY